jgi:hypothetical protein
MSTTIITFGPDQRPEPGAYFVIRGCDHEAARAIAFALFGPEFCTSYDGDSERGANILDNPERTMIGGVEVHLPPTGDLPGESSPLIDAMRRGEALFIDEAVLTDGDDQ